MTTVKFDCDRCHKPVEGFISELGTAGFYDVRPGNGWTKMGARGETFVCDDCVHASVPYKARSRKIVVQREKGVEFEWRHGKLIGPNDAGFGEAQDGS